jgi:AAA domain, putative AbiEii toxin, Type IV TA system/AAA domain
MKIRRVWLKDVGPFKELDIEIPAGKRPDRADVVVITGPNGSGKTTLLYALATLLSGGLDQLGRRWNHGGRVAVEVSIDGPEGLLPTTLNTLSFEPRSPLQNQTEIKHQALVEAFNDGGPPPPPGTAWHKQALKRIGLTNLRGTGPYAEQLADVKARNGRFSLITGPIFAYSATRSLNASRNLTIGDSGTDPIESAGVFAKSLETDAFDLWVANTKTKVALAREDGDTAAVARYERALKNIENAISELIDDDFSLKVSREPLEVLGVLNGANVPLNMLPDGLRSSLAWLGDVLRRLDLISKPDDVDPLLLPIIVLLDEIDAHLHPEWQRKILYVAERLLPNAQLIVSTHSPFVVQSATDACIIKLGTHGESAEVVGPQSGSTFDAVLEDILGVRGDSFSVEIEAQLDTFKQQRNEVLQGKLPYAVLEARAKELAALSESLDLSLQRHLVDVKVRIGAA